MRKLRKPAPFLAGRYPSFPYTSRTADGNWGMAENLMAASAEKNAAPLARDPRPPDRKRRRPALGGTSDRPLVETTSSSTSLPPKAKAAPVRSARLARVAQRWLKP